jgi:hypothetical protein
VSSDVPAVVDELRAALERAAALDPTELADPSLLVGLAELYDAETVLRAVQTRWLAVADARETTVAIAGRASRSWLIEDCQLGGRDASARLRLARTLPAFPLVEEAFAAARVTADQAAAIVAALVDVPRELRDAVEPALVARAGELTPFALSRMTDQLLVELDVETGKDRAEGARQRRLARRGVDLDATFEGTGSLAGTLTPEVYDAVKLALDAIDPAGARGGEDDRTPRQRRHDALGALARHYLDTAPGLPAVNGERPRVVVTIAARDLRDPKHEPLSRDRWGQLDSGLPVAPETTRRLACDAQLLPVVLNDHGDVLRLGRTTRMWSAGQRRAAWIRDRGRCAFPRCRRPPVDLHHVTWWSDGGHTDLDNGAWLCAFHHWLVHEAAWTLRRDPQRGYVFTAPDGREISHSPPRQRQPA